MWKKTHNYTKANPETERQSQNSKLYYTAKQIQQQNLTVTSSTTTIPQTKKKIYFSQHYVRMLKGSCFIQKAP